jgi:hypothetical protein
MLAVAVGTGCRREIPEGFLVVTQVPLDPPADFSPKDLLDEHYPPGSRVTLLLSHSNDPKAKVLSAKLHAAGGPVLAPAGDRVLFVGKAAADGEWQVYESSLTRAGPVVLSSMAGGAMGPVYLPDGRIAFSSPVPRHGQKLTGPGLPEIYAQSLREPQATRLTYGLAGATEATVLGDGRILFVSGGSAHAAVTNQALFTINTDGTEISAFAGQHDGRVRLRRPRESRDGRVLFLSSGLASAGVEGALEQVLTARPFSSRSTISGVTAVRGAEPVADGRVWVTTSGVQGGETFGVYALSPAPSADQGLERIFDDPEWHEVEVAVRRPGPPPMGRLSTLTEGMPTGRLLCLDANYRDHDAAPAGADARSVRFFRATEQGEMETLGEIPLQADGSFLAEVPANTLLGLETLDEAGRVVAHLPPSFWVRPGENRSCIGCHEPHNSCPENRRPLAVTQPAAQLTPPVTGLAQAPRTVQ